MTADNGLGNGRRSHEAVSSTSSGRPTMPRLRIAGAALWLGMLLAHQASAADNPQVQLSDQPNAVIQRVLSEISATEIESNMHNLVGFGTRHTLSDQDDPKRGIGAARRFITSTLERYSEANGGRLQVSQYTFTQEAAPRVPEPTSITNVVAMLPADSKAGRDRWLVVSGHYDSCVCTQDALDATSDAPGANDDASGTAAVMELARVMSKQKFDATIVFMLVAGEEQGLLGARHWAAQMRKEKRNIEAMFTNDIIGNVRGGNGQRVNNRVRLFSEGVPSAETAEAARLRQSIGGENDSPSRQLARYVKEAGERYVPGFEVTLVFRRDRFGRGGDHIGFLEQGYPALRLTEANEHFDRQHQRVRTEGDVAYGDVLDAVDFDYVATVTKVNAAALAAMALAPPPPQQVRYDGGRQSYDTTLTWKAAPGASAYRVLWRETSAPLWQHARMVGKAEQYTLAGYSKDDYFFAVQSLDEQGDASVPVYPGVPAAP